MKRVLQSLFLMFAVVFGAAEASAQQSLTFVVRSQTDGVINYKLWSQNRNHVWPSVRNAYVLNHRGDQRSNRLNCVAGETICYGAWFRNNPKIVWGAGTDGRKRCTSCCFVCNGTATAPKILTYTPRQGGFGR